MKVSSINQTIEQLFKAILTILFVYIIHYIFINKKEVANLFGINESNVTSIMAVWANIASTISTAIGLAYLYAYYKIHKKDFKTKEQNKIDNESKKKIIAEEKISLKKTIKMILSLSIPMSLASIVSAINRNIDSFTVNNIMQEMMPIIKPELAGNAIVAETTRLYGILSGKVDMLIGLPLAINIAFATALVPAITESIAKKDTKLAKDRINFSIKTSLLIALPCAIGLFILAGPILELLFHTQLTTSPESELLLKISSFTIIFTVLNQTINASLQGLGKIYIPAIALLCGAVVKYILNITLMHIPSINIYGAAIGSVLCHFIATIIVSIFLNKTIKLDLNRIDIFLKPLIATVIMAFTTILTFKLLIITIGHSRIITILSLLVAVVSYFLSVIKLNIYKKEEYYLLPMGKNIFNLLKKLKLIKEKS